MAVFVVYSVLFLAMAGHSSAIYCICKDGLSDSVLQKNIDYACGAGADCTPISQNGACYNPNTVKDHCNYAVNSYFQKKGQATGSCDFSGTATTSQTLASPQSSTCSYPSSSSSTTPSTNSSTTPTTTPTTGTPSTSTPGTTPSIFGLGPSGSGGLTNTESGSVALHQNTNLFCSFTLTLLFSGLMFLRV
uniref:Putative PLASMODESMATA CALLOSE-BINDING PROTEIN 3 n=1 Tax=Davidia involucrata TaxID=16924 RepID=A0A5B6Z839_DAVIN